MAVHSVMYDTATFHTRLDGTEDAGLRRRSIHQYYTRGSWDEHGRPPIQYPGKRLLASAEKSGCEAVKSQAHAAGAQASGTLSRSGWR